MLHAPIVSVLLWMFAGVSLGLGIFAVAEHQAKKPSLTHLLLQE